MSLCLKPFWTFFLSPVIKLHITIWKVWVESTYFFLYGIQIKAIWIMICRTSIFISPTFSPIFVQFLSKLPVFQELQGMYLFRILLAMWVNAFNEPFLDYEKDELIIVTSTGTKKQKWNCQKGWKIGVYSHIINDSYYMTHNMCLSFKVTNRWIIRTDFK